MRPKLTLMNILLLTTFCALCFQTYRMRNQLRRSDALIVRYELFRKQATRVTQKELELHAAINRLLPRMDAMLLYRWLGRKENGMEQVLDSQAMFSMPIGFRKEVAETRRIECELKHARRKLQAMGLEIAVVARK